MSAPKALLSDTKLVCQFPDESLISIGGQGPTQTQWPKHPLTGWGRGKQFHWTEVNPGAASHGTSRTFNLLRKTAPEMFMGMGFTDREKHQERESPAQHVYSPAPDSELQPLPFILRPTQCGSPSPLSSGHEWDCLSRDWTSLQMLGVQERLQVKLQARFISLRMKAEQTSPAGHGQAQHPP